MGVRALPADFARPPGAPACLSTTRAPRFLWGDTTRVDLQSLARMHPPAFRELAPLQRLATAVLHQVVDDVRSVETPRLIREDACRFVRSPGFLVWCSLTEVNPEAARAKLVLTLAEDDPPGDTRRVIGPTRRGSR